jgi:hypothetical protein
MLHDHFKIAQSNLVHTKYNITLYSYISDIKMGDLYKIKTKLIHSTILNSTDSFQIENLKIGGYLIEVFIVSIFTIKLSSIGFLNFLKLDYFWN